jgi:hypothetical protein
MYTTKTGLVLGFHGCDESIVDNILLGKEDLKQSDNTYDWLGHGVYFWENSPSRALEFAKFLKTHPQKAKNPIKVPAVIGAVIDLGYCLDFTDYSNLQLLKDGYNLLMTAISKSGVKLANKPIGETKDLLLRDLDCAVIETLHSLRSSKSDLKSFDSVRGVFWEGTEIYPNAGFKEKNHIQICVRNKNCIKGYFSPRQLDSGSPKV